MTFKPLMPEKPMQRLLCDCFEPNRLREVRARRAEMGFHLEAQHTECEAWKTLLELVDEAASTGLKRFAPLEKLPHGQETEIVTLPSSIARLKNVEALEFYGSSLVRIPPEIGEMESLKYLDLYTSYRLHWLPHEITRCRKLRDSWVSTRALYGNFKFKPPPRF